MVGDCFEPAAEPLGRVVAERLHGANQLQQHVLGDVLGVGFLEAPAAAPAVDAGALTADELRPGGLIRRGLP
jgi:hypothetical protein